MGAARGTSYCLAYRRYVVDVVYKTELTRGLLGRSRLAAVERSIVAAFTEGGGNDNNRLNATLSLAYEVSVFGTVRHTSDGTASCNSEPVKGDTNTAWLSYSIRTCGVVSTWRNIPSGLLKCGIYWSCEVVEGQCRYAVLRWSVLIG